MPRSRRHYRITIEDVLEAHALALKFGGRPGAIDLGLAKSAIARPYSGYHRSIHRKAAALVHSVARNHAFVDGNKRTALYIMNTLLLRSGYQLRSRDPVTLNREVEAMILDVVDGSVDFDSLVDWFKTRIERLPG